MLMMVLASLVINQDLIPYAKVGYSIVLNNCSKEQINLPKTMYINYDDLKSPIIGLCEMPTNERYKNKYFIIHIDKKYWTNANEDVKITIMLHEISHCILDNDHSKDPNNYMYFKLPYEITKEQTIKQFTKDVLNKCKKNTK